MPIRSTEIDPLALLACKIQKGRLVGTAGFQLAMHCRLEAGGPRRDDLTHAFVNKWLLLCQALGRTEGDRDCKRTEPFRGRQRGVDTDASHPLSF